MSLLSQHASRIQTLTIGEVRDSKDGSLVTLLHQPLCSLESLTLSFPPADDQFWHPTELLDTEDPSNNLFIWTPQLSNYPNLTDLSLGGAITFASPPLVFPSLRKLALRDNNGPEFSLSSFIQFIAQHLNLEELALDSYRPLVDEPLHESLTFPVTLRKFSLKDYMFYTQPFLSSFNLIPSQVRLSLTRLCDYVYDEELGCFTEDMNNWVSDISVLGIMPDVFHAEYEDDDDEDEEDEDSNAWVHKRAQYFRFHSNNIHHRLPVLSRVASIEVTGDQDHSYTFHGRASPGDLQAAPIVSLTAQLPSPASKEQREGFRLLDDIITMFASAPLTELHITSHGAAGVSPTQWVTFLTAFPTLERIAIEETVPTDLPFDARIGLLGVLLDGWGANVKQLTLAMYPFSYGRMMTRDLILELDLLRTCLDTRMVLGMKLDELRLLTSSKQEQEFRTEMERSFASLVNTLHIDFIDTPRTHIMLSEAIYISEMK